MASGVTIRSLAAAPARRWQQTSLPPAISISSENPADPGDQRFVPLLEEDARAGASMLLLARNGLEASSQRVGERVGGSGAIDQPPESADHREEAGHVTLVEQMDGETGAGEVLDDPGL